MTENEEKTDKPKDEVEEEKKKDEKAEKLAPISNTPPPVSELTKDPPELSVPQGTTKAPEPKVMAIPEITKTPALSRPTGVDWASKARDCLAGTCRPPVAKLPRPAIPFKRIQENK
jgi:hypothetical protein